MNGHLQSHDWLRAPHEKDCLSAHNAPVRRKACAKFSCTRLHSRVNATSVITPFAMPYLSSPVAVACDNFVVLLVKCTRDVVQIFGNKAIPPPISTSILYFYSVIEDNEDKTATTYFIFVFGGGSQPTPRPLATSVSVVRIKLNTLQIQRYAPVIYSKTKVKLLSVTILLPATGCDVWKIFNEPSPNL